MNPHASELDTHPDAHFHHAFHNLPDWALQTSPATRGALKNARLALPDWHATATPEQHRQLKTAIEEHWTQRKRLESRLSTLQNAREFAEPLLNDALKTRFGLQLDVKTTFLRLYIPQTIPWFSVKSGAARTWTVSLLEAALHNFQDAETKEDAHEPDSTYITEPSPSGQFDTLPAIKRRLPVADFARLCRELDIGGKYQAYLKETLGLNDPMASAVLESSTVVTLKAALRSALQLAHIREELPIDAYRSMLDIAHGVENVMLDGQRLQGHDLTIMSSLLSGIVVFASELESARQAKRIIVYIPDDPEQPLKHYPDATAFIKELTRKLREPAYQVFFSRFVEHGERGHFFADLNHRLSTVTWHQRQHGDPLPNWRNTPVDKPILQFSVAPFQGDVWTHLYQQQVSKVLNDARTLAVSTASADRNARWAQWDAFSKVALSVLEVASFVALPFVPFLGELMLAYMAYQLLDATFEGVVDWAEGLKTEAFGQLISVVETVVQLGTFAVGGAMAAGAFSRLLKPETVSLLAPLKPVETTAGKTRYWRPDLAPYEQPTPLPAQASPDRLGLYQHQGKTLLPLEGKLYGVRPHGETGSFTIEHPKRADAYQPPLRHNDHGAWQTPLDQPLTWDRETVMRRLGHSVESFSSAEREQILRISGFHDNVLRQTHVELDRPPSLLTDTLKRFKIDRDIQALVDSDDADEAQRHQAINQRLSLFESRYRELEQTEDRLVRTLLDNAQGLPTDIAQELVSNASGTELMELDAGRVPQRLKDVVVKAMEAVRAARAYEGFYLEEMESADTHRLALHSLESLPGWSAQVRLEVREYHPDGTLQASTGQPDASIVRTVVQAEDGTFQVQQINEPFADFYQAIFQALPQKQRSELGLSASDGTLLKQRIVDHAAKTPAVRRLFAKYPVRKPFYDPATMRLPGGGQGYEHLASPVDGNGQTPIARQALSLNDRVRHVYPNLDPQELELMVAELQRHPNGARMELSRLAEEREQLHLDLNTWENQTPTVHPQTGLPLSPLEQQAMQHNRRLIAREIKKCWLRMSTRDIDAPDGSPRYVLRFNDTVPGDLPQLTADFSHVSMLVLKGNHHPHNIAGFLQPFKGLRRLELRQFALGSIPDSTAQMANLDALVLSDCAIHFDAVAWSRLSSLKKLKTLDLYRNAFQITPDIGSLSELTDLDLSHTGLTELPGGVLQHTKLANLMLQDNNITDLPTNLFGSPVHLRQGVDLSNNPLTLQARKLIKLHYEEEFYDLGVSAPEADIARVRALYPTMEYELASDFVYELPGTLEDGRAALTVLEAELARLSDDLSAWTANVPPLHPLTGEPFDAQQLFVEHANRDAFKQLLEQCWRHETALDDFNDSLVPTFELNINLPINGELPTLHANFNDVSALELQSANGVTRIGRFLEFFPNLRSLRLQGCQLGDIPDAVFNMGRLRSLSLHDCQISLSAQSANALAGLDTLDFLDLGFNPLGRTPDLSQMPALSTVLLNDTGITEIPNGLFQLTDLDWVDLSSNAITEVPTDLLELPVEIAENFTLRGNPFSEESLARLMAYFERTRIDFGIEEVINQGEMDASTPEVSEVED